MGFIIGKCAILKSGKREIAEGKESPSQGSIKTLEEKENYKYLKYILEGEPTNKRRNEKIILKNTSDGQLSFAKACFVAEISSEG